MIAVQPQAQPIYQGQPVLQPVQPVPQPVQPAPQPLQPVPQPVQPATQPVQPQPLPQPSVYYPAATSPQFTSPNPNQSMTYYPSMVVPTVPVTTVPTVPTVPTVSTAPNITINNISNNVEETKNEETQSRAVVLNNGPIPRTSCVLYCNLCKKEVHTVVNFESNFLVWVIGIILYFFTFCLFIIPFMITDLKDAVHYCPFCRRELARNKK